MKATIERAALLRAMRHANAIVERRNTLPILAHVLIEAAGTEVTFRATDLDVELVDRMEAKVDASGATTVSAGIFHDIVSKLPDGAEITLTLGDEEKHLTVEAGRSHFRLVTLNSHDFPTMSAMSEAEYPARFTIGDDALLGIIDKAKMAMSSEETRYYLNGIYLHVAERDDGKILRGVATDGHRLAQIDSPLPEGAEKMPGIIVPRKTVTELSRILTGKGTTIEVAVSDARIRIGGEGFVLTSKVIEGTFPDYTRVVPKEVERTLKVDASSLGQAVDRVATVSSERSRGVKMALSEGELKLSVNAPDSGTAEEVVIAEFGGELFETGFNARYLKEITDILGREKATFGFNGAGDPTVLRGDGSADAVYVIMPMRI